MKSVVCYLMVLYLSLTMQASPPETGPELKAKRLFSEQQPVERELSSSSLSPSPRRRSPVVKQSAISKSDSQSIPDILAPMTSHVSTEYPEHQTSEQAIVQPSPVSIASVEYPILRSPEQATFQSPPPSVTTAEYSVKRSPEPAVFQPPTSLISRRYSQPNSEVSSF